MEPKLDGGIMGSPSDNGRHCLTCRPPSQRRRLYLLNYIAAATILSALWSLRAARLPFPGNRSGPAPSYTVRREDIVDTSDARTGFKEPLLSPTFFTGHKVEVVNLSLHKSSLIHVRNVCLAGGRDGFVVPHMEEAERALKDRFPHYVPGTNWPLPFRSFTSNETLEPFSFGGGGGGGTKGTPVLVPEPTFFLNCWRVGPSSTNPAHWLMKVNKMFEVAETLQQGNQGLMNEKLLPRFGNLALHQCPRLSSMLAEPSSWPWGKHVFLSATEHWKEAGLWSSLKSVRIVEMDTGQNNWRCFEDLYFETTYGSWFPAPQYQASWRKALLDGFMSSPSQDDPQGEIARRERDVKSPGGSITAGDDNDTTIAALNDRCRHGAVRILVFQRASGSALRRFHNIDEVRAMLSAHTSVPIEIATVDADTHVREQAHLFAYGFDLLVTPHGSHLANMIFCDPSRTAVVEVVPAVYDPVFQLNAQEMGMRSYRMSTGHRALCNQCDRLKKDRCSVDVRTALWKCEDQHVRLTLLQHDMAVDTRLLSKEVEKSLAALCNEAGQG